MLNTFTQKFLITKHLHILYSEYTFDTDNFNLLLLLALYF